MSYETIRKAIQEMAELAEVSEETFMRNITAEKFFTLARIRGLI